VKLPQAEAVQIDARKVGAYLLSQTHPVGRFKARVFAAVGFDDTKTDDFIAEVRRIAAVGDVTEVKDFAYGRKYTVPGDLTGSAGSLQVVTVWIQEPGRAEVRLVTVRPR
jgi:hypothetical protein